MTSSDESKVAIVRIDAASYGGVSYEAAFYLQGKSEGSATIGLYDAPSAPSTLVVVSASTVTATAMSNKLVTDARWHHSPASVYAFPETASYAVQIEHKLTQKPFGSTAAHYGYVFSTVEFSDGSRLAVTPSQQAGNATSPNVVLERSEAGVASSYYKVSVSSAAVKECVSDATSTVTMAYSLCGTAVIMSAVPMLIDVPGPRRIQSFSIASSTLTPEGGAGTLAGISLPWWLAFSLQIEFDDGSSVPFASEAGVVYTATDASDDGRRERSCVDRGV